MYLINKNENLLDCDECTNTIDTHTGGKPVSPLSCNYFTS